MSKRKRLKVRRSFPARFASTAVKTGMGRPNQEVLREYHERAASREVELTTRMKQQISEALGLNLMQDKRWAGQLWVASEHKYMSAAEYYSQKAKIFLNNSEIRFLRIPNTDVRLFFTEKQDEWFFVRAGWKSGSYESKEAAMNAFERERVSFMYEFDLPISDT